MIERHVDGDLAQTLSLSIEHLDSAVTAIRNVDISLSVDRNAMRSIELPGFASRFTPGFEPFTIFVDLGDPRIDVAVADVSVVGFVPRYICYLSEHPVLGRSWGGSVLQWPGAVIRSLLLAAEHHNYASLRIEFNDHVRTLVGNPDVVLAIDLDRVRVRPRVEVVADLAHELAVSAKLEKLRTH